VISTFTDSCLEAVGSGPKHLSNHSLKKVEQLQERAVTAFMEAVAAVAAKEE
jgi:hypothetical protein